jgi:hypothetical protein
MLTRCLVDSECDPATREQTLLPLSLPRRALGARSTADGRICGLAGEAVCRVRATALDRLSACERTLQSRRRAFDFTFRLCSGDLLRKVLLRRTKYAHSVILCQRWCFSWAEWATTRRRCISSSSASVTLHAYAHSLSEYVCLMTPYTRRPSTLRRSRTTTTFGKICSNTLKPVLVSSPVPRLYSH